MKGDFRVTANRIEMIGIINKKRPATIVVHLDRSLGDWEFKLESGVVFFGCKAWENLKKNGPNPIGIGDIHTN